MNQETVQALFTVQPLRQLTADNTYLLDRDHSVANGALVYETPDIPHQDELPVHAGDLRAGDCGVRLDAGQSRGRHSLCADQGRCPPRRCSPGCRIPAPRSTLATTTTSQNLDGACATGLPDGACDPNNTTPPRANAAIERWAADLYQGVLSVPVLGLNDASSQSEEETEGLEGPRIGLRRYNSRLRGYCVTPSSLAW